MPSARQLIILFAWAAVLTLCVGWASIRIQRSYLQHHSFFYDPVSYQMMNAGRALRIERIGRVAAAAEDWTDNVRCPLRTTPLILFAPSLLVHPAGYLATALPALLAFLFLLGLTVSRRSSSVIYALGCMALVCALPGLFHPNLGFNAYWLDLVAALYAGCALLCLLNCGRHGTLAWFAGFGAFAAAAALSRYIAVFYVVIGCLPVLGVLLFQRWRTERDLRSWFLPLIIVGAVFSLAAGYFVVAHLRTNVEYYTTFQYDKQAGIATAARFLFGSAGDYVGMPIALILTGVFSVNLALAWRQTSCIGSLALSLFPVVAVLGFLIVILQPTLAVAQVLPYPLVFLLATVFAPVGWPARKFLVVVGLALIVMSFSLGHAHAWASLSIAARASDVENKSFDQALARRLVEQPGIATWSSLYDEQYVVVTMEAFYASGRFVAPALGTFSIHESYWRGRFPGLSPAEVAEAAYQRICQTSDLIVVLEDPTAAESVMINPYSRAVAAHAASRVRDDGRWTRVFDLEHSHYGRVVGYRNEAAPESERVYEEATRFYLR